MNATVSQTVPLASEAGKRSVSQLNLRALIVEDFETMRKTVVKVLGSLNMKVIEASNGIDALKVLDTYTAKEALEQIKKQPPQVILTDGTLADMDAKAFAPAVRKVLGNKPVVIIAWSSSPEAEELLLAPDSGIDDFVLKSTTSEGTGLLAAALLGSLR